MNTGVDRGGDDGEADDDAGDAGAGEPAVAQPAIRPLSITWTTAAGGEPRRRVLIAQ
jgi:hypothetical protein